MFSPIETGLEGSSSPKVTVLICTLNEADSLSNVLREISGAIDEILIVDGHSGDDTVRIARRIRPDARILYQEGKGKGNALKLGVGEALGDIIVTLDADGETPPEELPRFLGALRTGCHVAKGSRLARGRPPRMPIMRWLGNRILAQVFNLLYGTRFTDICSGYSAFWKRVFLQVSPLSDGFQMEQEFLSKVCRAGFRVVEIPHASHGRTAGVSKTKSFRQGLIDLLTVVSERFHG